MIFQDQSPIFRLMRGLTMIALLVAVYGILNASIELKTITLKSSNETTLVENGLMVIIQENGQYYATMKVFDNHDPSNPQLLSATTINFPSPQKAWLYHAYVYIPDEWGMILYRYSLLNPAAPVLNYGYEFNVVGFRDLTFYDHYALMTTQDLGLRIIDIAHTNHATEVGHYTDGNPLMKVWSDGNYAAVLSYNLDTDISTLKLIDISNPAAPFSWGLIPLQDYEYNYAINVLFYQNYLHVIWDYNNSAAYDLSGTSPQLLGEFGDGIRDFTMYNDYRICLMGGSLNVQIMETPLDFMDIATYDMNSVSNQHLEIDYPYVYLIRDSYSGYNYCYDISNLNPPEEITYTYDTGDTAQYGSALAGYQNWLYYEGTCAALSPEGQITSVQPCPDLSDVGALKVEGAWMICYQNYGLGCKLLSLANPEVPQTVDTFDIDVENACVSGNLLIISNIESTRGFDITIPSSPQLLFCINEGLRSPYIDGNYLWGTDSYSIVIYNLENLQAPFLLNTVQLGDSAISRYPRLYFNGDYMYVSGFTSEIRVYNISDPMNVSYVGSAQLPMQYDSVSQPPWLTLDGKLAVITELAHQLVLYDLSNPCVPQYISHLSLPYRIYCGYQYQDLLFTKRNNLIYAIQYPDPSHTDDSAVVPVPVLSSMPNPFSRETSIRIDMDMLRSGNAISAQLGIFNLRGQKLRTIPVKPQLHGIQELIWNGRDDKGRSCANGMYIIRLKAPGCSPAVKKVTLLR